MPEVDKVLSLNGLEKVTYLFTNIDFFIAELRENTAISCSSEPSDSKAEQLIYTGASDKSNGEKLDSSSIISHLETLLKNENFGEVIKDLEDFLLSSKLLLDKVEFHINKPDSINKWYKKVTKQRLNRVNYCAELAKTVALQAKKDCREDRRTLENEKITGGNVAKINKEENKLNKDKIEKHIPVAQPLRKSYTLIALSVVHKTTENVKDNEKLNDVRNTLIESTKNDLGQQLAQVLSEVDSEFNKFKDKIDVLNNSKKFNLNKLKKLKSKFNDKIAHLKKMLNEFKEICNSDEKKAIDEKIICISNMLEKKMAESLDIINYKKIADKLAEKCVNYQNSLKERINFQVVSTLPEGVVKKYRYLGTMEINTEKVIEEANKELTFNIVAAPNYSSDLHASKTYPKLYNEINRYNIVENLRNKLNKQDGSFKQRLGDFKTEFDKKTTRKILCDDKSSIGERFVNSVLDLLDSFAIFAIRLNVMMLKEVPSCEKPVTMFFEKKFYGQLTVRSIEKIYAEIPVSTPIPTAA